MDGWTNELKGMKEKLYQLLLLTCDSDDNNNGDVNITQNLGIAMTHAVKKGGVINVISQSISFQKVIPKIIEVMRDVDRLEMKQPREILQIAHIKDPVEDCCEYFFEKGTTWKEFRDITKKRYFDYIRSRLRSNNEAAKFLDVTSSMVSKGVRDMEHEDC